MTPNDNGPMTRARAVYLRRSRDWRDRAWAATVFNVPLHQMARAHLAMALFAELAEARDERVVAAGVEGRPAGGQPGAPVAGLAGPGLAGVVSRPGLGVHAHRPGRDGTPGPTGGGAR